MVVHGFYSDVTACGLSSHFFLFLFIFFFGLNVKQYFVEFCTILIGVFVDLVMDLNVEKPVKRKSTSTKEIRDNIVSERGQTKDGVGDAKPSQQSSKEEVDSLAMKWRKRLKNNKSYFIQLLLRLIPHLLKQNDQLGKVVMISILTRKLLNFYSNQYFYLTEADLKSYRFEPLPVGKEESSCKVKSAFSINDILSYYGSVIHLIDMERILKMDPNYFTPKYLLKYVRLMIVVGLGDFVVYWGLYAGTKEDAWASLLPVILNIGFVMFLVFKLRHKLYRMILVFATEKPEFPEIFLADILSSMIKVLVDAGSLICEFVLKLVCLKVSSDIVRREKVCIWVMVSNALLRFTWIWPLFPKFPKNDVDTASCIATAIDGDENIASVIVIASSIAITFATTVDTNTDAAFSIATTSNRGRDIASVIAIAFATAIGSATHTASSIDTTIDIEDIASAIAIDGASNTATARESNTDLTRSRSRSPGPIDTYWNYDCLCWN
ncbi:hypothetical protein ACOSQ4_002625 [Xanthoceras sorbifolium]